MKPEPINSNAPSGVAVQRLVSSPENQGTADPKYVHCCNQCGTPLMGAEFCVKCERLRDGDSERMDWLEKNRTTINIRYAENERPIPLVCLTNGDKNPELAAVTLRGCIDKAMLSERLLAHLKSNPPESSRDMCGLVAVTKKTPEEIRAALEPLKSSGEVRCYGNGKRNVWAANDQGEARRQ